MKALWLDYKEIVFVMRNNVNRFIKYQLATKLLLMIVFMPLFRSAFNLALKSKGMSYLTNNLLQKFIVSPQGAMMILFSLVFGFTVVLIEMGGLIILSHQVLLDEKESSFIQVILYALKRMKRFFGLDGLLIALYIFLIAPMLESNLKTSILSSIKIPGFVMDVILSRGIYITTLILGFMVFVFLAYRWMFALHIILLEEKEEKRFLKASGKLVFKNWKFILKHSLIVAAMNMLVMAGIAVAFILLSAVILLVFAGVAFEPVFIVLFSIGFILFWCGLFFFTPFQLVHMTMIYHKISGGDPKPLMVKSERKVHILDHMISSRKVIINGFIIAVIAMSIFNVWMYEEIENMRYVVDITAHRGSSKDAPENTLSAIGVAIENGASYVEIDVQETKDQGVVLLHDKSLKRTTGLDQNVWELTTEEIQALDSGLWFDEAFEGEKIPTLDETMTYAWGKIKLNIEIKPNDTDKALVASVVKLIQDKNYYNHCVVTSLDYDTLQEVEKLDPKIKTGYVMFVALGQLEDLNIDFYSVEETNVTEAFVTKAHAIGREVHVWTINSTESMNKVLDLGVDNIITDNDKMLSDLIKSKNTQ